MKIIAQSTIKNRDAFTQPFRVVIRHNGREFVTHCENVTENIGPGGFVSKPIPDYYWGHYISDAKEAMADFVARCDKYKLQPIFG